MIIGAFDVHAFQRIFNGQVCFVWFMFRSRHQEETPEQRYSKAWTKPDQKSDLYKDWDTRITRCQQNAAALDSASQTIPGGVGTRGVSLIIPQQTPEEKIANSNYKQSIAEQTVKSATTKLNSTQQVYTATLDTYRKTSESLKSVSEDLQKAREEIAKLEAGKMGLVCITPLCQEI
jgi:hypothetical protein